MAIQVSGKYTVIGYLWVLQGLRALKAEQHDHVPCPRLDGEGDPIPWGRREPIALGFTV